MQVEFVEILIYGHSSDSSRTCSAHLNLCLGETVHIADRGIRMNNIEQGGIIWKHTSIPFVMLAFVEEYLPCQKQIGNRQHYKFTRLCSFHQAGTVAQTRIARETQQFSTFLHFQQTRVLGCLGVEERASKQRRSRKPLQVPEPS